MVRLPAVHWSEWFGYSYQLYKVGYELYDGCRTCKYVQINSIEGVVIR